MPPRTLFSEDHHFGNRALLGARPGIRHSFGTMAAHDVGLITRWNPAVHPGYTVRHLGDFRHHWPEAKASGILARLAGNAARDGSRP